MLAEQIGVWMAILSIGLFLLIGLILLLTVDPKVGFAESRGELATGEQNAF